LDSGFLQIPHWLPSGSGLASALFRKVQGEFLRAPLPSPTCSLLPRAMAGFAPASRLACRSHATALRACATVPTTNGLTGCRMCLHIACAAPGPAALTLLRRYARTPIRDYPRCAARFHGGQRRIICEWTHENANGLANIGPGSHYLRIGIKWFVSETTMYCHAAFLDKFPGLGDCRNGRFRRGSVTHGRNPTWLRP